MSRLHDVSETRGGHKLVIEEGVDKVYTVFTQSGNTEIFNFRTKSLAEAVKMYNELCAAEADKIRSLQ